LGNLYLQAGQFEKARDSLRKAESLQPNNPETEYGLALAYGKLGDREEAKIHMGRFQQLRPGAPKKN
jgi:Flp pilus assembly protein TadD